MPPLSGQGIRQEMSKAQEGARPWGPGLTWGTWDLRLVHAATDMKTSFCRVKAELTADIKGCTWMCHASRIPPLWYCNLHSKGLKKDMPTNPDRRNQEVIARERSADVVSELLGEPLTGRGGAEVPPRPKELRDFCLESLSTQ